MRLAADPSRGRGIHLDLCQSVRVQARRGRAAARRLDPCVGSVGWTSALGGAASPDAGLAGSTCGRVGFSVRPCGPSDRCSCADPGLRRTRTARGVGVPGRRRHSGGDRAGQDDPAKAWRAGPVGVASCRISGESSVARGRVHRMARPYPSNRPRSVRQTTLGHGAFWQGAFVAEQTGLVGRRTRDRHDSSDAIHPAARPGGLGPGRANDSSSASALVANRRPSTAVLPLAAGANRCAVPPRMAMYPPSGPCSSAQTPRKARRRLYAA